MLNIVEQITTPVGGEIAARPLSPSTFGQVSIWAVYACSVAMTESDSEKFHGEAEECRQMAARAINPHDKTAWLKACQ
jgi:hypothetical protein